MILYALITEQSIGALFIAGIMPGIMMVVIFSLYIAIRAKLNPQIAPSLPGVTWKERFASLRGVWAFLLVIVTVLGTIYAGVCTATEAAAVGAFASFIIALVYRRMNWAVLKEALFRTVRTSCFIFFIIFGAMTFAYLLCYLRIPMELSALVASTGLSPIQVLIMINVLFLILGMFLDPAGILVLTLPVLFPVVQALGFNPIWFGVIMTMNMEMANITPPVGLNLFVIKSISPEEVTLGEIIRGAAPFVGLLALGIALLVIFPSIALWLPGMMR